jgi:hypothetical protein
METDAAISGMTIYIPIGDTNEAVEVAVDDLPDDEGEILGILQAELAPLDVWLHVAKAYSSKGKEEQFRNILEEATQPGEKSAG